MFEPAALPAEETQRALVPVKMCVLWSPEVITEGNVERHLYANGDNDTEAILLKVVNGGHYWFDMTLGGLSFEQIIWQFFSNN